MNVLDNTHRDKVREHRKKLYTLLSSEGWDMGSFEALDAELDKPHRVADLWEDIASWDNSGSFGSKEDFLRDMGAVYATDAIASQPAKASAVASVSESSPLPSSDIATLPAFSKEGQRSVSSSFDGEGLVGRTAKSGAYSSLANAVGVKEDSSVPAAHPISLPHSNTSKHKVLTQPDSITEQGLAASADSLPEAEVVAKRPAYTDEERSASGGFGNPKAKEAWYSRYGGWLQSRDKSFAANGIKQHTLEDFERPDVLVGGGSYEKQSVGDVASFKVGLSLLKYQNLKAWTSAQLVPKFAVEEATFERMYADLYRLTEQSEEGQAILKAHEGKGSSEVKKHLYELMARKFEPEIAQIEEAKDALFEYKFAPALTAARKLYDGIEFANNFVKISEKFPDDKFTRERDAFEHLSREYISDYTSARAGAWESLGDGSGAASASDRTRLLYKAMRDSGYLPIYFAGRNTREVSERLSEGDVPFKQDVVDFLGHATTNFLKSSLGGSVATAYDAAEEKAYRDALTSRIKAGERLSDAEVYYLTSLGLRGVLDSYKGKRISEWGGELLGASVGMMSSGHLMSRTNSVLLDDIFGLAARVANTRAGRSAFKLLTRSGDFLSRTKAGAYLGRYLGSGVVGVGRAAKGAVYMFDPAMAAREGMRYATDEYAVSVVDGGLKGYDIKEGRGTLDAMAGGALSAFAEQWSEQLGAGIPSFGVSAALNKGFDKFAKSAMGKRLSSTSLGRLLHAIKQNPLGASLKEYMRFTNMLDEASSELWGDALLVAFGYEDGKQVFSSDHLKEVVKGTLFLGGIMNLPRVVGGSIDWASDTREHILAMHHMERGGYRADAERLFEEFKGRDVSAIQEAMAAVGHDKTLSDAEKRHRVLALSGASYLLGRAGVQASARDTLIEPADTIPSDETSDAVDAPVADVSTPSVEHSSHNDGGAAVEGVDLSTALGVSDGDVDYDLVQRLAYRERMGEDTELLARELGEHYPQYEDAYRAARGLEDSDTAKRRMSLEAVMHADGNVYRGILNDKEVAILRGGIALHADGSIDYAGSDTSVMVRDEASGEVYQAPMEALKSVERVSFDVAWEQLQREGNRQTDLAVPAGVEHELPSGSSDLRSELIGRLSAVNSRMSSAARERGSRVFSDRIARIGESKAIGDALQSLSWLESHASAVGSVDFRNNAEQVREYMLWYEGEHGSLEGAFSDMVDSSDVVDNRAADRGSDVKEGIVPIGNGEFGPIYDQFRGDAKGAVAFLLQQETGEALGALHHKDIGDIDLVWGKAGSGRSDGFGLAKLAQYHPEVLDNMQAILDDMHVASRSDNRVHLESERYQASVRLTWNERQKSWLLTLFEKRNSVRGNRTDTATTLAGNENDTATLANAVSTSKVSESFGGGQVEVSENVSVSTAAGRWSALLSSCGGDVGMALSIAEEMVEDSEGALRKLEKGKPKRGGSLEDKLAAHQAHREALSAAAGAVRHWREVVLYGRAAMAVDAVEAAEGVSAGEVDSAALSAIPDMAEDTASAARERGFRRWQGEAYARQGALEGVVGKAVEVRFTDTKLVKGRVMVVDAGVLQPSHLHGGRNPMHFIDEAQPKERKDSVSAVAAERMAKALRAEEITGSVTAYSGAPVVNGRGEVIQGNNRARALRMLWSEYPEQASAYKAYLVEHAGEFGFDGSAVEGMAAPVLVSVVDVSDAAAIELGQYVASHTESGGVERIKAEHTIGLLGSDFGVFADMLLDSTEEEGTSELIGRNGGRVLSWLARHRYITETQFKSAFDADGRLTTGVKEDLRDLLYARLFVGAPTQLAAMFEVLPSRVKQALLGVAYRADGVADGVLKELHESIGAYYTLWTGDKAFKEAKDFEEAYKAVLSASTQLSFGDMGQVGVRLSSFSNFALVLAALYRGGSQAAVKRLLTEVLDRVHGVGGVDMFEAGRRGAVSLAEAIDGAVSLLGGNTNLLNGFRYDGKFGGDVLAVSDGTRTSGGQGGVVDVGSSGGGEGGKGSAELGGGTELGSGATEGKDLGEEAVASDLEGRSLTSDEAKLLLSQMRSRAGVARSLEITPENWSSEFGSDGEVETPIGKVKMGAHQYEKLLSHGREASFGLIKPTLESPDVVIEDYRPSKLGNGGRDTSYLFVKAFVDSDGSKHYFFTSVTVSQGNLEVVVSNGYRRGNRISTLLQQGTIKWIDNSISLRSSSQVEGSVPRSVSRRPTSTDTQSAMHGNTSPNAIEASADKVSESFGDEQVSVDGVGSSVLSVEAPITLPSGYGANNRLVSRARHDELVRRLRAKLGGQLNAGIDPELLSLGMELGLYHVEAGARKFADFARVLVGLLGDSVRPYLKAYYNGVRDLPEVISAGWSDEMTPYDEVRVFSLDSLDSANNSIPLHDTPSNVGHDTDTIISSTHDNEEVHVRAGGSDRRGTSRQEHRPHEPLGAETGHEAEQPNTPGVGGRGKPHLGDDGVGGGSVSRSSALTTDVVTPSEEAADALEDVGSKPAALPAKSVSAVASSEAVEGAPAIRNSRNNRGARGVDYVPETKQGRILANFDAIALLRDLQERGEAATPEEMAVLRQFSGWGGLSELLSKPEYRSRLIALFGEDGLAGIAESALTSYYTPAYVSDVLWDIAVALGFDGGVVLESSAGIGNILGQMPESIASKSVIRAIEKEEVSGGILGLLYPDAEVSVSGMEAVPIGNNSVGLAITNVPFATGFLVNDKSGDGDLSRLFGSNLHDYAIAKNVRKLRSGGIGIFITTSGTLDKSDKLRAWLVGAGGVDVVGAFRLNNETFEGTRVTSDIVVVRKRGADGAKSAHAIDVLRTEVVRSVSVEDKLVPLYYNSYFVHHPEYMAGEMALGAEHGDTFRPKSSGLYANGVDQVARLASFVGDLGAKDWGTTTFEEVVEAAPSYEALGEGVKEGSLVLNSKGEFVIARDGVGVPAGFNSHKVKGYTKQEVYSDYVSVKDTLAAVLDYQRVVADDAGLSPLLAALNAAFDRFVDKYGHFVGRNARNLAWLRDNDVDYSEVAALAKARLVGTADGGTEEVFEKSDVMRERVVRVSGGEVFSDARAGVMASLRHLNRVDVGYIADVLGRDVGEVRAELLRDGAVYEDPTSGLLEPAHLYLSGDIREKLAAARAQNSGGRYSGNIVALEGVLPAELPTHLIDFNIGSNWLPSDLFAEFIEEVTGVKSSVTLVGSLWAVSDASGSRYVFGKNRASGVYSEQFGTWTSGLKIIEAAMNNKSIEVSRKITGKPRAVDKVATAAVQDKIEQVRADFKEWLHGKLRSDAALSSVVGRLYNDKFRSFVPVRMPQELVPTRFVGASERITLRAHQGAAAMRALTQPLLLHHEVGTGKTFTMLTAAMEMRRMGVAKKPMLVVQNATLSQFGASAKVLYPTAKVLLFGEDDKSADGRRAFYANIRYNDWDMVIISQSAFNRIPDSPARVESYLKSLIEERMATLSRASFGEGSKEADAAMKRLHREVEDLEARLAKVRDGGISAKELKEQAKRENNARARAERMLERDTDDVLDFDELGIDALFVDEAHEYKRLGFSTSIAQGVKGVDPSYSKKCQGLFLKVQSVFERTGGKNVVFATGTPVSNTAAEVWTFLRYLNPDALAKRGVSHFDDFVRNFGDLRSTPEFATNGVYKIVSRLAGYSGMPELSRMYSEMADVVRTVDAGEVQEKIPEIETGKAQDIFLPQTPSLREVMLYVKEEYAAYEKMEGKEKRANRHIPAVLYGVANAAAVDTRLVVANGADDAGSKTNRAVLEALRSLKETEAYRGVVAIFADRYQNKASGFNLYEDIRAKLIAKGVPGESVVVMKQDMSDVKKAQIFEKVNSGDIRVVLGSTQTLGTGVNIQERLHTLIHLDAPNRPMDYTQRNGRILRQGNLHRDWDKAVRILRFGVEDSLDVTAYQRLQTKSKMSEAIANMAYYLLDGDAERTLEDDLDNFGDMLAMLSGSEYALLKNQAEKDVKRLEARFAQWKADQAYIYVEKPKVRAGIADAERLRADAQSALSKVSELFPDGGYKVVSVGKLRFGSVGEMGDFLKAQNKKLHELSEYVKRGDGQGQVTSDVSVSFDGVVFDFKTSVRRVTASSGGVLKQKAERDLRYSCATLGLVDVPVKGGLLKDGLLDVVENVLSGKDFMEVRDVQAGVVRRLSSQLADMEARDGKPFADTEALAEAKARLVELEGLMQAEMAAKAAKYAEMDAGLSAAEGVSYDEEGAGDEGEVRHRLGVVADRHEEGLAQTTMRFNEQLLALSEENADTIVLELGMPSKVLQAAGVVAKPMRLYGNKLVKKAKKHGFSIQELKDLPLAMARPIAVFDNQGVAGNRAVLTELRTSEGHVLAAVSLGKGGDVDVNLISSVFGKRDTSVLSWLSKGYATYIDKEKALSYLHLSAPIAEASNTTELSSIAKIIENFENPKIESPKKEATADASLVAYGGVVNQVLGGVAQLHSDLDSAIAASSGRGIDRSAKGWYDVSTGAVHIHVFNHTHEADLERTILHEVVGHKGLRGLLGNGFDRFLDEVYKSLGAERIGFVADSSRELSEQVAWRRELTEEYLAELAEEPDTYEASIWDKVVAVFRKALRRLGIVDWSDSDLKALLREARQRTELLGVVGEGVSYRGGTKKSALDTALGEESPLKGAVISRTDGAKLAKNIDTAIAKYENREIKDIKSLVGDMATALGIDTKDKSSKYVTIEAKNGKVFTLRLSNHNAHVSNFDVHGEAEGISIVISRKPNEGVANDGDAHVKEFFYSDKALRRASGKPLAEILKGIKQALYSGEYVDRTGLAEVHEVNAQGAADGSIRYRWGRPRKGNEGAKWRTMTADEVRSAFDQRLNGFMHNAKEIVVDKLQSVQELQKLVGNLHGLGTEGLPEWADAYTAAMLEDSRAAALIERANIRYWKPLVESGKGLRMAMGWTQSNLEVYMMQRSGLERNGYMTIKAAMEALGSSRAAEELWEAYVTYRDAVYGRDLSASEQQRAIHDWITAHTGLAVRDASGFSGIAGVSALDTKDSLSSYDIRHIVAWHEEGMRVSDVVERYKQEYSALDSELTAVRKALESNPGDAILLARGESLSRAFKASKEHLDAAKRILRKVETSDAYHNALNAQAFSALASVESVMGTSDVNYAESFWSAVKDVNVANLDVQVSYGLLSEASAATLKKAMPNYVPLRGYEGRIDSGRRESADVMHADGRSSKSDSPLLYMKQSLAAAINQGVRNVTGLRLLNMAEQFANPLMTPVRLWVLNADVASSRYEGIGRVIDASTNMFVPDFSGAVSPADIKARIDAFEGLVRELRLEGLVSRPTSGDIQSYVDAADERRAVVTMKRGGVPYAVYMNAGARVATALNGGLRPKTGDDLGAFMRKTRAISSKLMTFYDPDFIFKNYQRDLMFSAMNSKASLRQVSNSFNSAVMIAPLLYKWVNGKLSMAKPMERNFYDFMRSGGETGFTHALTLEEHRVAMEGLFSDSAWHNEVNIFKHVEYLNRVVELSNRFAAYQTARALGESVERSVMAAKESTTNFNRSGSGSNGLAVGGFAARSMLRLLRFMMKMTEWQSFTNASIQGANALRKAAVRDPWKFALWAAIHAFNGALRVLLYTHFSSDDNDEETRVGALNESDFVLGNSLVIDDLRLPLAHGYRAFSVLGFELAAVYSGLKSWGDAVSNIAVTFANEGGSPIAFSPRGWVTFLGPAYDVWVNEDFLGRKIVDDSDAAKAMPYYKRGNYTRQPALVSTLGRWLYERFDLDWNTAAAYHLSKGLLGGIGRQVDKGIKWYDGSAKKRDAFLVGSMLSDLDVTTQNARLSRMVYGFEDELAAARKKVNATYDDASKGLLEGVSPEVVDSLRHVPGYAWSNTATEYARRMAGLGKFAALVDEPNGSNRVPASDVFELTYRSSGKQARDLIGEAEAAMAKGDMVEAERLRTLSQRYYDHQKMVGLFLLALEDASDVNDVHRISEVWSPFSDALGKGLENLSSAEYLLAKRYLDRMRLHKDNTPIVEAWAVASQK